MSNDGDGARSVGSLTVAAAHLTPVFLDRDATLAVVVAEIERAADGAHLVVFPESFAPG